MRAARRNHMIYKNRESYELFSILTDLLLLDLRTFYAQIETIASKLKVKEII